MMGLLTVSLVTGCGKPPMRQVTGTVSLNGKLVEHCKVGFFPDVVEFNPDRHGFGFGVTDAEADSRSSILRARRGSGRELTR